MIRHALSVVVLLVLTCPAGAMSLLHGNGVVLEVSDAAPVGIRALRAAPDGPSLFLDPNTIEPTWLLVMTAPDGEEVTVDPVSAKLRARVVAEGRRLRARWESAAVPSGAVKVSCAWEADAEQPLVYGRIQVENDSQCKLLEVQFPKLTLRPTPEPAESATIAFPRAYGRSWRNPFAGPRGFLVGAHVLRGYQSEIQFGTIYDDAGNGLYWACYDTEGYQRSYSYESVPDEGLLRLTIGQMPEDCHKPGQDYRSPYAVALGAYHGDWWDAAHLYRTWALRQWWCRRGPTYRRTDVPQWIKEADVWIRGDSRKYEMDVADGFYRNIQEIFGGTIGVQWYSWHDPPNWADPLRWPPKAGFAELCARSAERGIMAMPYVNSLQWDTAASTWTEDARKWALIDPDALPRAGENFGSATPICMCAATDLWRETMVEACVRLVRDAHVKGVYLDQLGGQCGRPCWAADHGHPVGGGSYATKALREICSACRTEMRKNEPEAAISGEVQHEFFIDVTDVRLTHYNVWPGWINLWAAVYGDMIPTFGRTITWTGDRGEGLDFYGRCGNTFVAGIQFARLWPAADESKWLDAPAFAEQREYFKLLVDLRRAAKKFLGFGWLQRGVKLLNEVPELTMMDAKGREMQIAAVLDSAWAAHDGTLGFVFTNIGDGAQAIEWEADLSRYEIEPAKAYRIARVGRKGEREPLGDIEGALLHRTEELPGHSALVLEVIPQTQ